MKGEPEFMKSILKYVRESFVLACEAYYNTYLR